MTRDGVSDAIISKFNLLHLLEKQAKRAEPLQTPKKLQRAMTLKV